MAGKQRIKALPFLARGALGGVIGGLIVLLGSVILSAISNPGVFGYAPYVAVFIFQVIPLALALGALMGGFVGGSIWILSIASGRGLDIAARALIGFVLSLIVMGLFAYFHTDEPGFDHPPVSWTRQAVSWVMMGAIMGMLPGMMARGKATQPK